MIITKKEQSILYLALRSCGLSYRAACNIDIEAARKLKSMGLLRLQDKGEKKDKGRFVFRATDLGLSALEGKKPNE